MASMPRGAHPSEGAAGSVPTIPVPPLPAVVESRMRRYWKHMWDTFRMTLQLLSLLGTVLLLAFQYFYPWGYSMPFGLSMPFGMTDPGAPVYLTAAALCGVYLVTRLPHLIGQEPGDWVGLWREATYNLLNVALAFWFIAKAPTIAHPPNAVGVSNMLLVFLIGMFYWQMAQAVILARRTWSDSSGGSVE